MTCPTGLTAALYVQPTDGTPAALDDILGELWENVKDVSMSGSAATADVSSRESAGFRETCSTLKDVSIEITAQYVASDDQLEDVREAWEDNTTLDVTMLTAKEGAYEGIVGRFAVTGFGLAQPLEEGQTFPITLSLREWGEWLSGTHTPPEE